MLALPLLYWQWVARVRDWTGRTATRPCDEAAYYRRPAGFLDASMASPFRIDIPFTANHWESTLGRAARPAGARMGAPGGPPAQPALL